MTNKGYVDLNTACVGYQSIPEKIVSTAAAKRRFVCGALDLLVCGALDLHLLGSSLSCFFLNAFPSFEGVPSPPSPEVHCLFPLTWRRYVLEGLRESSEILEFG